jgi:purine-nucleoside phosphorylase
MALPPDQPALEALAGSLRSLLGGRPDVAIILGSGLSAVSQHLGLTTLAAYADLRLPQPTVVGHAGRVAGGSLSGVRVLAFEGRAHLYEGNTLEASTRAVRLALAAGVRVIILTNAAGGLAARLGVGDIMALTDHVSLPGLCGYAPAATESGYPWPLFVDQDEIYDEGLRLAGRDAAERLGFVLHEGVYAMVWGPVYESPAERRLLSLLGGDAVGMSTVPEAVAAHAGGAKVLALSVITNVAAASVPTTHSEVTRVTALAARRIADLTASLVQGLGKAS